MYVVRKEKGIKMKDSKTKLIKSAKRKTKRQIEKEYKVNKAKCAVVNTNEKDLVDLLKKKKIVVLLITSSKKYIIEAEPKTKFKRVNKILKKAAESTNKIVT